MAKPGCPVQGQTGKDIWQFLVYDSRARKMGSQRQAWQAQRKHLLETFEKNDPGGYKRLFDH